MAKKIIPWADIDPLLGTQSDKSIADSYGLNHTTIFKRRKQLGIPSATKNLVKTTVNGQWYLPQTSEWFDKKYRQKVPARQNELVMQDLRAWSDLLECGMTRCRASMSPEEARAMLDVLRGVDDLRENLAAWLTPILHHSRPTIPVSRLYGLAVDRQEVVVKWKVRPLELLPKVEALSEVDGLALVEWAERLNADPGDRDGWKKELALFQK